jgi:hypothetical protein
MVGPDSQEATMDETPLRPTDDAEFWVIPLHGASVPLPPSADVPSPPADPPTADGPDVVEFLLPPDDVPSDEGFHPRLRRSA